MSMRSFFRTFVVLGISLVVSGCGTAGVSNGGATPGAGGAGSINGGVVPASNGSAQSIASGATTVPVRVYVANTFPDSVTVYSESASCGTNGINGNVKPVATIAGTNTGLNFARYVALDASKKLYVTNYNGNSVTVYAAGATGNVKPVATIAGSNTLLSMPNGVAVGATGKIYVANQQAGPAFGYVTVYAAGANGNVKPIATISGSNTGIDFPQGLALDQNANIYVTNLDNNSITVYAAGANGNVAPMRTISGSNTGLATPYDIALDTNGNIYVSNEGVQSVSTVRVYAAGANGNVSPTAQILGGETTGWLLVGIAWANNKVYVSSNGLSAVIVYPASANNMLFPTQYWAGANTHVNNPYGIAVR